MKITVVEKNGVSLVQVASERIDAHNSDAMKERIKQLFDEGARDVLVDLHEVVFIDSSGLGALVSVFKRAMTCRGRLALAGLREQVRSMFELTRLNRVFDIYATVDEAVSSFAGRNGSGPSPGVGRR
jgi:anti-sigma B factor antagonist